MDPFGWSSAANVPTSVPAVRSMENVKPHFDVIADSVDATAEDIKPNEPGPAPSIAAVGIAPAGAAATDNNFITEAGKWFS